MKYENPIIRGFNPDPSICKAGDTYYLVTSSFEYFPGIPLYQSVDLLNWELIGHCINRSSQLPMEKAYPSGGIWAPVIRYLDGKLYVTATFSNMGNFIIYANEKDMVWSDPVRVNMGGIDPSLYFENGKAYYCTNERGSHNEEGISLAEINVESGKLTGNIKYIWEGMHGGFIEAPHIYLIDNWYYLIVAEGGTGLNHMVNIARSRNIWGPYESCLNNPVLTNRNDTSKQISCAGHGDLVFDNENNLWMVHLAIRPSNGSKSHLGRETFLTPLKLCNGWIISENTKAQLENKAPTNTVQKIISEWQADFSTGKFSSEWMFLRNPDMNMFQLKDNTLMLYPQKIKLSDEEGSPSFAAVRPLDMEFVISACMEFETEKEGDEAGLALYLSPSYHYKLAKKHENDNEYIMVEKLADDFKQITFKQQIKSVNITLLIKAFKEKFEFYYSYNNEHYIYMGNASTRFLTCEVSDKCFTGMVAGIYAQSEHDTNAKAIIYSMKQERILNINLKAESFPK